MGNNIKECKYLGEYSGDCWLCSGNIFQRCMYSNKEKCLLLKNEQRKNKINVLEQQLLAEQAKNKELENQRTVDCEECERNNSKNASCFECLCIKLNSEQAKNKKLVEALEKIAYRDITIKSNFYSSTVANEALNEVNK